MENKKIYTKKLYIDYEYTIFEQKEYLIGVLYNETKLKKLKYIWFKTTNEFINWVAVSPWKRIKIYAHWGIKADFKFICRKLKKYEIGVGSKFIVCDINGKEVKLIDTTFLVPSSLKEIGKQLKLYKKEKSILYDHYSEVDYSSERFKQIVEYNKMDCYIISQLKKFFKNVSLLKKINVKDTIASTSFRFLFDVPNIKRFTNEDIDNAYRGGFCEIFKMNEKNLKCYDINSLYPSVMSEWIANPYKTPYKVLKRNEENAGIYFTTIKDYSNLISFVRIKQDLRNVYVNPSGLSVWLTSSELDYLNKHNNEFTIKYGYEVEKYYKMKEIITDMYKLREQPEYKYPIKLCLNSSYGKFGERDHIEKVLKVLDCAENIDYLHKILKNTNNYRILDGVYYFNIKENKRTPYRNILTASNITGSAREKLFNLFDKAGHDKVSYSDTDSVYTTASLDNECSLSLGKLKIEYEIKEALFLGRKAYFLNINDEIQEKMKGTSRKVKIIKDLDMFDKVKEKFLSSNTLELQSIFKTLTTSHEYMKTGQHEKIVKKNLTFNPNKYRDFLKFNNSILYNTETMPKSKSLIKAEKMAANFKNEQVKEIIKSDYFDTYAYNTHDKSLVQSVNDLMEGFKYE